MVWVFMDNTNKPILKNESRPGDYIYIISVIEFNSDELDQRPSIISINDEQLENDS